MNQAIPESLKSAYQKCQALAFGHYENFPVASLLLPEQTRPHVAALYAYARTADDFADEPLFEGVRLKKLNEWERNFQQALKGKSAPEELRAFAHTVKTFQIPTSLPLDLLRAFRMDIVCHRYKSWKALLYYCRHSANPVGRMVLLLHGIKEEKLHVYSDFICSGLQLINFWQDTAQDLERGRIYYPKEEMKRASVRERDLFQGFDSPPVQTLVRNALDFTENHFRQGLPLLDSVSGRLRLELRATYLGGMGILNKIRQNNYNVLQHRPTLSKMDKAGLALKVLLGVV